MCAIPVPEGKRLCRPFFLPHGDNPPRGGRVICLGAPPLCCHRAFYHQMSPMPLKGGDINSLNGLLKVTRYKTWSQA
jgi:hypothetical protein